MIEKVRHRGKLENSRVLQRARPVFEISNRRSDYAIAAGLRNESCGAFAMIRARRDDRLGLHWISHFLRC